MKKSKTRSQKTFSIEDWEINEGTARKMMKHLKVPGNDMSNIVDYNDQVMDQIKGAYREKKPKITTEQARYKDDEDEIRYCKLRKIPDERDGSRGKRGRVKGYKTIIYLVTFSGVNLQDSVVYYDIVTIKPPPPDDN